MEGYQMRKIISNIKVFAIVLTLVNFAPLLIKGQVLRYQDLHYQRCDNCDNNMNSGSMPVPNNGFTYSTIYNFSSNPTHAVSDFGPRTQGSRYHIGIDISPQVENYDNGDAIFPIETGEIKFLHISSGYKYIAISGVHHYGFGHIFFWGVPNVNTGMRSGDFILKKCDDVDEDLWAIIYCPEGETPIAFGTSNTATIVSIAILKS